MPKLSRSHLTVAAATAAAAVGGTAIAGAADNASSTATGAQRSSRGAGETPLTGATKEKVQAAALAEVAGTVLRVETDAGGAYEAHIRKADGTEVEVKVSKSFEVTAVNEMDGGHRGGPGGHGHGPGARADLAAVAQQLGVTEAKLRSAVDAARPADDHKDRGDWAADLARALGAETAQVQQILDANRPQRDPGGGRDHGRLDDSALVAALAQGLSKSEAQVRSALTKLEQARRAEHTARESALYAAVAKALGKDAAAVKAAFEAARPTP